MSRYAEIIGYLVMLAGGCLLAAGIFGVSAYLVNMAGMRLYKKTVAVYRLETLRYWLRRMDEEGTHIVRKGYEEQKSHLAE